MDDADDGRRIEGRGPEVLQDGPPALHAETGRRLHPGVGDEDPQSRKVGAEEDEERGDAVGPRGNPVPAEDEDPEEHGFEEEREDRLGGERGAEDVADRPGIGRPVVAEGELEGDARGHAHDENGAQDLDEIDRQLLIGLVLCSCVERLDEDDEERQAERRRREQEVEPGRDPELEPGEEDGVHDREILDQAPGRVNAGRALIRPPARDNIGSCPGMTHPCLSKKRRPST